MRRMSFWVMPALASVAVLAGAGSSVAGAAVKAHPAAVTKISVKATEFHFALSASKLAKPGTVTFTIKNAGHIPHDFSIDNKKSAMLSPGKSGTLTVKFTKAGKYAYKCTVPGHAASGMKGVFTVK